MHHIAAIKTGTDPIAPLPKATFHRTLEEPIYCPKCDATYMLIVDYDWAVSRHFEDESRRHIRLLRNAVLIGHSHNHRITHFETNGVVVSRHTAEEQPAPLTALKPATKLLQ